MIINHTLRFQTNKGLVDGRYPGDLSFLSKEWKGFRIYNGDLWTPEGDRVTAGDVRAVDYCDMTMRFQSNQIRRLEAEIMKLEKSLENSRFLFDFPANDAFF